VTTIGMELSATFREILPEALPEKTAFPFIVIEEVDGCAAMGVTVVALTSWSTVREYDIVEGSKAGVIFPAERDKPDKSAMADAVLSEAVGEPEDESLQPTRNVAIRKNPPNILIKFFPKLIFSIYLSPPITRMPTFTSANSLD